MTIGIVRVSALLLGAASAFVWAGPVAGENDTIFATGFESASTSIAQARAAQDGSVAIPVNGAVVTYLKPQVDAELAGFFVQAEKAGPALFVAVNPATTVPQAQAGDVVSFSITHLTTVGGMRWVDAIDGFARRSSGTPLAPLVQDVSATSDLVSNLDAYESELLSITASIGSAFASAGSGFLSARIDTSGISGDSNLALRATTGVVDTFDLVSGCTFSASAIPMWRFGTKAQPSTYAIEDFDTVNCPAPTVVAATAASSTSVTVTFSRNLDPASIAGDGSQFTFDNGLLALGAVASGKSVTVTTTAQAGGTTYTVIAASTIADVLGAHVGMPDSAQFAAFVTPAKAIINEINANILGGHDLVELLVTQSGTTSGLTLHQVGSTDELLATLPAIEVSAGDLIVVHLVPTMSETCIETTSKSQCPSALTSTYYDAAWDVLGGTTGLTYTCRVLEVRSASDALVDAVPFALPTTPSPPASFPSIVQQLQAAGWWLPVDCSGSLCTYVSTPSVFDISVDTTGLGTTASGNSVQRKSGGTNTHSRPDWNAAAASTFGAANP